LGQADVIINPREFLRQYRLALPELEKALYRNKDIQARLWEYSREDNGNVISQCGTINYKSNTDRFVIQHEHADGHVGVQILRPDHLYLMNRPVSGSYKITTDRTVSENMAEQLVQAPWWGYPSCSTTAGLGHGVTSYEIDWYTSLSNGDLEFDRVTETVDHGRRCYRIEVAKVDKWFVTDLILHFDKSNFFMYHEKYTSGKRTSVGLELDSFLDFDMIPGDYSSLVIKSYKQYATYKPSKLDHFLRFEHSYSVFKTATHPPETFRLEQFGLPDVVERPRATSRRAVGLVAAGVVIGGLLVVAWARGRRKPKATERPGMARSS
jgi:hypothetical protein